jgi:hypothetical protein
VRYFALHRASSAEIDLVLVVHGDTDEKFSVPRSTSNVLTQFVAPCYEVVRIAGDRGISHVGEFYRLLGRKL